MKTSKRIIGYRRQRGTLHTSRKGHTYTPKQRKRIRQKSKQGRRFF